MLIGVLISSAGASMIWPFLMIYVSKKLTLPLSTVATLVSINAATSLVAALFAGNLTDRKGRKMVMVVSLMTNGLIYVFMSQAGTYLAFALLMILTGASNPLYQVGADAMLADLIPPEDRTQAYALQRTVNNAGIAIGPAVGGFIASRSYTVAFMGAALGMILYGLLMLFRARETLTDEIRQSGVRNQNRLGGFEQVFQDQKYLAFVSLIALGLIAPSMMWVLLAVYTKTNFGLTESLYGWIPTTNALMCVFIQVLVTQGTRRLPRLTVSTLGMLIYAIGVGSIALMSHFWGFWLSMVVITFGELLLIPTITTVVANYAPIEQRGRYMSVYWFGWGLARVFSPLIGGFLNDSLSPRSIWIGGLVIGLSSTVGLLLFQRSKRFSISV